MSTLAAPEGKRRFRGKSRRSPPKGCSGAARGKEPRRLLCRILPTPRRSSSGARAATAMARPTPRSMRSPPSSSRSGSSPATRSPCSSPISRLQPLTLLAAWRAGLTVAVLPMLWRGYEIGKVCEAIEPKALIGVSTFAGARPAEELCRVAAPHLFVRFVLGFGQELPDGVASLDEAILPRPGMRPLAGSAAQGTGAHHLHRARRRAAHPRPSQRGRASRARGDDRACAFARQPRRDPEPLPLTGPAGFALALAPWLISGAVLAQHQPFDYAVFVQQLLATRRDRHRAPLACPRGTRQGSGAGRAKMRATACRRGMDDVRAHASAVARDGCASLRSLSARRSRKHRASPRDAARSTPRFRSAPSRSARTATAPCSSRRGFARRTAMLARRGPAARACRAARGTQRTARAG